MRARFLRLGLALTTLSGVARAAAFGLPALGPGDAGLRASAVAAIVAAWLVAAVWAIVRGGRAKIEARAAKAWGLRLRGLLASAPGAYLIAGGDGSVSASDSLRAWLGLEQRLATLDDLAPNGDAGLAADDFAALRRDIAGASLSGQPFSRLVRPAGSRRFLLAQGRAAPVEVAGERGVAIWFRDTTDTQDAVDALSAEKATLQAALDAANAVIEAAPMPIWRRNDDLTLDTVNSAYVRAVDGASAEAVIAARNELVQNPLSTVPRAAAQRAREYAGAQVRDEPVIIGDARRMLEIHDVPLGGFGVAGYAVDVTEREEARAERDRFERAQTETLNRLSTAVALFAADCGLAFYNRAFCELFRLDDAALAERPEFDRVLEMMREARRLPESRDFPEWRRERRGWFTDAVEAHEEMWALPESAVVRVIAQPHPDGGLLIVFEDRTEQLRLASSRDVLVRVQQATLDNLHEAVAVFGANGRLQLSNRRFAALWKLDETGLASRPGIDELLGLTNAMVAPGGRDRAEEVREIIRVTTATENRESRAGQVDLVDGRALDFAAVPLPDGNVLFTYLDVTDSRSIQTALRDRNEALEAADRLKSAFVANISYELRTPLTAISGFGEMLAAGYAGTLNDRQGEYVGSIMTSTDRLQLLINDILDLATTEAGELALDVSEIGVRSLIVAVAAMAGDAARPRDLTLDVTAPEGIGGLEGDERRLKQVLYNLLANAIRFTPPGGRVGLSAAGDAETVTFTVTDSGIGIPEEEQALVFDRFRKGSNAGSQGVGLGLALVRQFVDLHHGTVELTSAVGEGTTVTVKLPRTQPAAFPSGERER